MVSMKLTSFVFAKNVSCCTIGLQHCDFSTKLPFVKISQNGSYFNLTR